jgi:D-alanyl-D-alanine carboxypeptidase
MAGRLRHLPLIAVLVWLQAAQGAAASPPLPLPNPDSPAFTPVVGPPGPTVRAVGPTSDSCQRMRKQVRTGNSRPGLMVRDLATGKRICSLNPKATRSLASNTKLFTTSTAFGRLGKEHRMRPRSGPMAYSTATCS